MSKEAWYDVSANKIVADGFVLAATRLCLYTDVGDMLDIVTFFCNVTVRKTIFKC